MPLPTPAPSYLSLSSSEENRVAAIQALADKGVALELDKHYFHWEEMRHRSPPPGLTHWQWWLAAKVLRHSRRIEVPLEDVYGHQHWFSVPRDAERLLHLIDISRSAPRSTTPLGVRGFPFGEPRARTLDTESISSSMIEGAETTMAQAKIMLRTKRPPQSHGEKMVVNNMAAMERVVEMAREPLTPSAVLELHAIITNGVLKPADASGRLRHDHEKVYVVMANGEVAHTPPASDDLSRRME
ncbi:MAG: hypothetical protein IT440_15900, partial [Phycisphaeraceae bacterium]|nr:hypothetical protein [Phycisphaeraceae bacterium]